MNEYAEGIRQQISLLKRYLTNHCLENYAVNMAVLDRIRRLRDDLKK